MNQNMQKLFEEMQNECNAAGGNLSYAAVFEYAYNKGYEHQKNATDKKDAKADKYMQETAKLALELERLCSVIQEDDECTIAEHARAAAQFADRDIPRVSNWSEIAVDPFAEGSAASVIWSREYYDEVQTLSINAVRNGA